MLQTKTMVIDADAHVLESEHTWDYLEPADRKYRPVPVTVPADPSIGRARPPQPFPAARPAAVPPGHPCSATLLPPASPVQPQPRSAWRRGAPAGRRENAV